MIKVNIKVVGALKKPFGKGELKHQCRKGTSLRRLLLDMKYDEKHLPHILAAVNGERKNHDFIMSDGDSIVLTTAIGGG